MCDQYPQPTYIYHITHIDNLPLIMSDGYLYSDNQLSTMAKPYLRIGHTHLKLRRQGSVHSTILVGDYVPFYYAPRSPMLYAIAHGGVEGYAGDQSSIVYLISTVQQAVTASLPFVISDGNATSILTSFYNTIDGLNRIDWNLMKQEFWNNTAQSPDRKRCRQAEFLVKDTFPTDLILGVAAQNQDMADRVQLCIARQIQNMKLLVKPAWYY